MKFLDKVKLINDNYVNQNIKQGEIGTILEAEIRDESFYVIFNNNSDTNWYKDCIIKIKDLELIEDGKATDEDILASIPLQNPKWWCKVEDGYIMNLLGEKKNKIPYDYDS